MLILAVKGEEYYQKVRGKYRHYESDLAIAKRMLGIGTMKRNKKR